MEHLSPVNLPDSRDAMLAACQNCVVRTRQSMIELNVRDNVDTRKLTGVTVKHDASSC